MSACIGYVFHANGNCIITPSTKTISRWSDPSSYQGYTCYEKIEGMFPIFTKYGYVQKSIRSYLCVHFEPLTEIIPFQLIQHVRNVQKVVVIARAIYMQYTCNIHARYTVMVIIVYLALLVSSVIMGAIASTTKVINIIIGLEALQTLTSTNAIQVTFLLNN